MLSHYKSVSKFARTTQRYASDQTKKYRQLMEGNHASYSTFFFAKLKGLTGDYDSTVVAVKSSKKELEEALSYIQIDIKNTTLQLTETPLGTSLSTALSTAYKNDWGLKRQKSFDYYTNAFLEYVSGINAATSDEEIVAKLSKSLTGIELSYWGDSHADEFKKRLIEIKQKIDAYTVSDTLNEGEIKMTLTTASGKKREVIFDDGALSDLGITMKNKLNATLGNFGLSISYNDKVQILLSLLNDLMEGKE